jgi:hypothetical protein
MLLFLFLGVAASAGDREGAEREIVSAMKRIHALLEEAEQLQKDGRAEEAARAREQAADLKRKIHEAMGRLDEGRGDPLRAALHKVEQAVETLRKASMEDLANDLNRAADRLRAELKEREAAAWNPEMDFLRRNIDTLRLAMKALAEAERRDAADLMERAIRAWTLALERKEGALGKVPSDGQLAELLLLAAGCWREFQQPEKAAQVEELGRFFQQRAEKRRGGPEDRLERLEARMERIERMLERMEERDRDR